MNLMLAHLLVYREIRAVERLRSFLIFIVTFHR